MSRVSLWNRIERLRNHLLPPGSIQWRIERLSPELRAQYQIWRERVDAINLRAENRGENIYERLLADPTFHPPMPKAVEYALWPHMREADKLAETDPAAAYHHMLQRNEE